MTAIRGLPRGGWDPWLAVAIATPLSPPQEPWMTREALMTDATDSSTCRSCGTG